MYYRRFFWGLVLGLLCNFPLSAQKKVIYSPARFGPNANPVFEVSEGKIPEFTRFGFSTDYSFGCGDKTLAWRIDAEVPLLPKYISAKIWMIVNELYWLTPENNYRRNIEKPVAFGWATGDLYVQTRFSILRETERRPQILASIVVKTACGTKFKQRRFFDTPGYAFYATVAKSFPVNTKFLKELRIVGDLGFYCWERTNSSQDDAGMYGINLILSNSFLTFENQLAGYYGRVNNGDRPVTYRTKLTYNHKFLDIFLQYQYGIINYPYHQIRLGIVVPVKILTPKYSMH